mmetsp:Transcript_8954/g.24876  ORF Transcript_8954/g.24876 Transcript_8954/m.24876 type:complete len:207 (-) Transcript_8954:155-775(-)
MARATDSTRSDGPARSRSRGARSAATGPPSPAAAPNSSADCVDTAGCGARGRAAGSPGGNDDDGIDGNAAALAVLSPARSRCARARSASNNEGTGPSPHAAGVPATDVPGTGGVPAAAPKAATRRRKELRAARAARAAWRSSCSGVGLWRMAAPGVSLPVSSRAFSWPGVGARTLLQEYVSWAPGKCIFSAASASCIACANLLCKS